MNIKKCCLEILLNHNNYKFKILGLLGFINSNHSHNHKKIK